MSTRQEVKMSEQVERYRIEPTGCGFWPFRVVAGDGTRALFIGNRGSCERVAAELTTAYRDGEFVGNRDYDALHAEAEALRAQRDKMAQILRDLVPGCKWRFMRPRIDQALQEVDDGN